MSLFLRRMYTGSSLILAKKEKKKKTYAIIYLAYVKTKSFTQLYPIYVMKIFVVFLNAGYPRQVIAYTHTHAHAHVYTHTHTYRYMCLQVRFISMH